MDIKTTLDYLRSYASENELLEFKEAKTTYNFNKLGKYFSALSNEANLLGKDDAWLVFGIKDKGKKNVGTRFRTDTAKLQSLKAEIAGKTTHRITFKEIHEINTGQGRVILFQIPPAPKGIPVAWAGHYYGREGEQLNALSLEELERIRKQGIENDWSIVTCKHAAITDLSEQAILLLGRPESEHFIHPGVAKISWILKDRENIEKDYAHFSCPFLLSIEEVYKKIRNLKYRYLPDGSLFPDEVDSYDPYIIREALNNCIAHQDYALGGKINVIESEDSLLIFVNMGSFIPQTIENVIIADAPESQYRNSFLSNAMVNLNMIDTIGSGIKKMFTIQKRKFFPLPEYTLTNNQVKVAITGKVLDTNYAKKLAQIPKLSLDDIILLDKVQKHKLLEDTEIKKLRKNRLIEGRKPNFYISFQVARKIDQKADYMHLKGIDDNYCKKIIVDYLRKFSEGKRADFEKILLDKLSGVLNEQQKKNKIKNYLQTLKKAGVINITGKTWQMSKDK